MRIRVTSMFGAVLLLGLAGGTGCGDDGDSTRDSSVTVDASADARSDGAQDGAPDSGAPDAGRDSGDTTDAGVEVDGDGDGVPAAEDCDDADSALGSSASRECSSACAIGLEVCAEGVWGSCDAASDCACSTPAEVRIVDCGNCGSTSQACGADGLWEMPVECFGEGECEAATIERDTAMCGAAARLCDSSCHWGSWEVTTPPGDCESGDTDPTTDGCPVGHRVRTCTASCAWDAGTCIDGCASPPETSRTGADPVCIPAGDFIFAKRTGSSALTRRFTLSEFYVDRNPVTKSRFEACVSAGACPAPTNAQYVAAAFDDLAYVTDPHTAAFCSWDGGSLVGAFQWSKAARGPAPDERNNPWGDFTGGCGEHPWVGCEHDVFTDTMSVTAHPSSISPYGVHLMGTMYETTAGAGPSAVDSRIWLLPTEDPDSGAPGCCITKGAVWTAGSVDSWAYREPNAVDLHVSSAGSIRPSAFRCRY